MCFMFVTWEPEVRTREHASNEFVEKAGSFTKRHSNMIFVSTGQGLKKDGVAVSFHENFADYVNFRREFETE